MKSLSFVAAAFFFVNFQTIAPAAETNTAPTSSRKLAVAAATNFVYALRELVDAFERISPAVDVSVAPGASGNLVAQIRQGAPFDVFLSADHEYPRALVESGEADASTLTNFARGRLVLWTTDPALPLHSVADTVRHPSVRKLAIAHAETAPYGRAACEVLNQLGLWDEVQPKLVTGENITQTAQFVATGNADAGFVALSLVLSPNLQQRGRWLEISQDLYRPLDHAAVITKRGHPNRAAHEFVAFLRSAAARAILERYGYNMPPASSRPSSPDTVPSG